MHWNIPGCGAILATLLIGLTGCEPAAKSGHGLVLPEGDVEVGKEAFSRHSCTRCHTVAGVELKEYVGAWEDPMELGGTIFQVKTYGELVTAITNPDHILSPEYLERLPEGRKEDPNYSPMPDLNSELLVRDLLDIVTFLHSRYIRIRPDFESDYYYLP